MLARIFYRRRCLPHDLLISPQATVRQIKNVVASRCRLIFDNFHLLIINKTDKEPKKLDCDEKTIEDYEIDFSDGKECTIYIVNDPMKVEPQQYRKDDIWLELEIIDARFTQTNNKLNWSLYVEETTKVVEIMEIMEKSPDLFTEEIFKASMCLQVRNVIITSEDALKTLKEVGLDFSMHDIFTMELTDTDPNSAKKRRARAPQNLEEHEANMTGLWNLYLNSTDKMLSRNETVDRELYSPQSPETETRPEIVYVGLVNQAMTCYLNSLLQALFMTPEFRNALYNWEYIDGADKDDSSSMPYQLQKLFLNLQTSKKNAVETTSLTKSFGWDSTEAWQQHDIQELCRVMFDALEQKFKNTEQADLINRLYEGKMIDYVKCLECRTEKSREDTFLDIPLPVRPFDSTVAYNSVEEALRAFVQPETLDDVNQYFCETCNKKCDAHKGLKFTKFPYLLTLHLKRFDFDYSTYHRIKLNDKVTFPDTLNLNSFITSADNLQESSLIDDDVASGVKGDDSSTTDSGNLDECLHCDNGLTLSEPIILTNEQEDDEGIDIGNCPSTSSIHSQENERNRSNRDNPGPYQYELFSIMIHSGSASGGHYYAYIKDFLTGDWLCFNDQNVSSITHDDIQKTYGGGPSRAYYSGAYSSSTNAYMLMYRQIDPDRNTLPMKVEDFPKHIQELLKKMKKQEKEKKNHEKSLTMHKILAYCFDPVDKKLKRSRIFALPEDTVKETVEKAWKGLNLENVVDLDQCRLVDYNNDLDIINCSYDGRENYCLSSILRPRPRHMHKTEHMLLEIKKKDEKFKIYSSNDRTTIVFVTDATTNKIIDGPHTLRVPRTMTVGEYKIALGQLLPNHLQRKHMKLFVMHPLNCKALENDAQIIGNVATVNSWKVFAEIGLDSVVNPFHDSHRNSEDVYANIVMIHIPFPDTRKEVLEKYNIPALEEKITNGSVKVVNGEVTGNKIDKNDIDEGNSWNTVQVENEEWQEQSNSEDSSLSDSDRTLVGDASEDDDFPLADIDNERWRNTGDKRRESDDEKEYFFKVGESIGTPTERLKVYVDYQITDQALAKHLEPIIKVPVIYFEIFRHSINPGDAKFQRPHERQTFEEGETVTIKFKRPLRDNEFKMKVYFLNLMLGWSPEYSCEWIVSEDMTIGQLKKDLVHEMKTNHNIDIVVEKCRLRRKNDKAPGQVFLNDQKIKNLDIRSQPEIIVQELSGEEPVTNTEQIVLLTSRLQCFYQQLQEIVVDNNSATEFRDKVCQNSYYISLGVYEYCAILI